ncbi:hypothetical protein C0Q70_12926 [Pomacea canaliculata]|uniref:Uncharacterized protein n=1 Tax=Pomacea canaliculata TaxID=400727 RepID=A0A2T7P2V9_POMCA|nr:hypothetical protein C0Q70_12926 [Pomacea canaliculata]
MFCRTAGPHLSQNYTKIYKKSLLLCASATDCSGAHQFKCGMRDSCIAIEYRCDGENDCVDGSEEAGCATRTCLQGELKCSNNVCVEISKLCNGHNGCGNGWDEDPTHCEM